MLNATLVEGIFHFRFIILCLVPLYYLLLDDDNKETNDNNNNTNDTNECRGQLLSCLVDINTIKHQA